VCPCVRCSALGEEERGIVEKGEESEGCWRSVASSSRRLILGGDVRKHRVVFLTS
jgi:hypothetical protein